jgi:threonine dehydratase
MSSALPFRSKSRDPMGFPKRDKFHELISLIDKSRIEQTYSKVSRIVPATPLVEVTDPFGGKFMAKLESFAPTGSFKVRGATNFVSTLVEETNSSVSSIYAASTGNHGLSLAFLANKLGVSLTVVVPIGTPTGKKSAIESYGAKVVLSGNSLNESLLLAADMANANRGVFAHSAHPLLIEGNSGLGLEIFRELSSSPKRLIFPIGIGSGIAGLVLARNLLSPKTKIIGVVPAVCPTWARSFDEGKPTYAPVGPTQAEGLKTSSPDPLVFDFLNRNLDGIIKVTEDEIYSAKIFCEDKKFGDPEVTGVVSVAGYFSYVRSGGDAEGSVAVICGSKKR